MELFDYIEGVWKRKALVLAGTTICFAAAAGYTFLKQDQYRAEASLWVQRTALSSHEFQHFSTFSDRPSLEVTVELTDMGQLSRAAAFAQAFRNSDLIDKAVKEFGLDEPPYDLSVQAVSEQSIVAAWPQKEGQLIVVQALLPDPELAAKLANFMAEEGMEELKSYLTSSGSGLREGLRERLAAIGEDLEQAEEGLLKARQESHLAGLRTRRDSLAARIKEMENRVSLNLAEIEKLKAERGVVRRKLAKNRSSDSPASLSDYLSRREAALSVELGGLDAACGKMQHEIEVAGERLARVAQEVAQKEAGLRKSERDLELQEHLYRKARTKTEELLLRVDSVPPAVQLIESAIAPDKPVPSSDLRLSIAGGFVGFGFSIALALLLTYVEEKRMQRAG